MKTYSKLGFYYYEYTRIDGKLSLGINNNGKCLYRTFNQENDRSYFRNILDGNLADYGVEVYPIPESALYINPCAVIAVSIKENKIYLKFPQGFIKTISYASREKALVALETIREKIASCSATGEGGADKATLLQVKAHLERLQADFDAVDLGEIGDKAEDDVVVHKKGFSGLEEIEGPKQFNDKITLNGNDIQVGDTSNTAATTR